MKPVRTIEADVLVVGGGTSGCMAALSAAEEGARVVLLESDSALGGVATRGGIHRYYYGSPGGLQELVDRRTGELAALFGGKTKGYHPEARRAALSLLTTERKVETVLNSVVDRVLLEGRTVVGVRALTPSGDLEVRAKTTVDCTGNASVVRMSGGVLRYGRELDGIYHNYSYIPRGLQEGVLGYDNLDAGWVDPYDPWDVSRAYLRGREWIREACEEGARYFGLSSMLGLREGGRIEGDDTMELADYIEDTPKAEIIARSYSHLDNHGFDTGNESEFSQLWISVLGLFTKGLWCDIPYGSLLPKGLEGILVGCRGLSADRDVSMGVRMQKDMHKVGEAAGVAAALCVRTDRTPRELDRAELQKRLVERGVLESADLDRQEGRNLRFAQGALAKMSLKEIAAGGQRTVHELTELLGTEEGWKAIWILARKLGPQAAVLEALSGRLSRGTLQEQMGSAIALCMMRRQEPVPFLLRLITDREPGKLSSHPKCVPLWVAAFILLRVLRSNSALDQALQALEETESSGLHTFLLDYLCTIIPELSAEERSRTARVLVHWVQRPELGSDYRMHGERPESLRWSLELRAAALLIRLGDKEKADRLLRHAESDPRGYVRRAAGRLVNREGTDEQQERVATELQLGEFDVAVFGGGVSAVVCAGKLARRGLRVVLAEGSSSLLTEITRARRTAWRLEQPLPQDSTGSRLIRCLEEFGACREGEAEPVLTQLAADRFLVESGAKILFEVLYREEMSLDTGDILVRVALKNGTGVLRTRHVVHFASPSGHRLEDRPAPVEFTLSALLIRTEGLQPFSVALDAHPAVQVSLRTGFYPDEAYMDLRWSGADQASDIQAAARIVHAMRELRSKALLPEESALAYIADTLWRSDAFDHEAGPGTGSDLPITRLLQAGEEAADRISAT